MKKQVLLFFAVALFATTTARVAAQNAVAIASPNGQITVQVFVNDRQALGYKVVFNGDNVIENSSLGVTVDNVQLGEKVRVDKAEQYEMDETYPWRSITHSTAINRCNGIRIPVTHLDSKTKYTVDFRVFDDGIAFRYEIPGKGNRIVSGEATSFVIPENSEVWYHDFHMHYEGQHERRNIAEVTKGEWVAPPLTFKLPGNKGYGAITESAIVNYSGMGLIADGKNGFNARLGHEQPVSYPYELRYSKEDVERLAKPAAIAGSINTPWRVVMIGKDLNTMVNCDIIYHVAPEADKKLFPNGFDEDWLKPGRAVWGYLTDEPRTLEGMKNLSRLAGQLGFEYHVVEGHWSRWTFKEQKELVDYSRQQGVKILLWMHSKNLQDPEKRKEFFKLCHDMGAAGAKIDFFDHEAKEVIDLYQACLREAAEYKLVLDFHGANKPAGEARTWPNELSREAIKGFETRGPFARHNVTLPFTRMLAGHADYTALHFGDRRCETSETHQIAGAIVLSSPLLVYAEHPGNILKHPAVEVIKKIPSVWDETVVLPCSAIGEVSAVAKRSGERWFISVMNGEQGRMVKLDLSFLDQGDYKVTLIRDKKPESAMTSLVRKRVSFGAQEGVIIDSETVRNNESLVVELIAAGGFVAMFEKVAGSQN